MKVFISQPMKVLSKVCNIDPGMRYSDPIMGVGESVKRMAEAGRSIEGALYEG